MCSSDLEKIGLVNRVLPLEELMPFVHAQAAKLAALPSESLRVTKQLMQADLQGGIVGAMQSEMQHFQKMLSGPDAKEAFTAFLEKRKPVFR